MAFPWDVLVFFTLFVMPLFLQRILFDVSVCDAVSQINRCGKRTEKNKTHREKGHMIIAGQKVDEDDIRNRLNLHRKAPEQSSENPVFLVFTYP